MNQPAIIPPEEPEEKNELVPQKPMQLDWSMATRGIEEARELVQFMADKCKGPAYITRIKGKNYPGYEWWSTVGSPLGLFPVEVSSVRLDREGEIAYEAVVEIRRGDQVVTRASAVCSNREKSKRSFEEYAIKSMATTRAGGKAYRLGLAWLAVMAGLQPTTAEEMDGVMDTGSKGGALEKGKKNLLDKAKEEKEEKPKLTIGTLKANFKTKREATSFILSQRMTGKITDEEAAALRKAVTKEYKA